MDDILQLKDAVRPPRAPRRSALQEPTIDPQVAAIVAARHGDPFACLGMHQTETGLVVRAILPGADAVLVVDAQRRAVVAEAAQVHPDGLFVAELSGSTERFPYRLRARWADVTHEFDDAYRFPPVLGDLDLHLLVEGTHLDSYRKLGAHATTMEGVGGVAFAVWAPNA